jgi:hypothetical protein
MYYQYELTHFKGDMGHGVASDEHHTILTSKFILDALRASTNRTPATSGKGLLGSAPAAAAA